MLVNFKIQGGKNKKSTNKAIKIIADVNNPIVALSLNDENDKMPKPITKTTEVTIKALPTVVKA